MTASRMGLAEIHDPDPLTAQEPESRRERTAVRRTEPAPQLLAVRLEELDEAAGAATVRIGAELVPAALDPSLEPAVLRTALRRRERVIAQQEAEGWVVLGALRTSATPGVDEAEAFSIRARRIELHGASEISLVSGMSALVLRARGFVETVAQDITTRASGIHKLVGRMIRLN
ncbi:MAG TPA: hypothetical protein VLS89_05690 [Candidatus Nanopelagicales bacterium]|nr:hypothetical protein [Candidatus Nanopelagicales bacterium]